jgi:uncharacterized protein
MTVRDLVWRGGAPARATLITAIGLYRVTLSGWLGGQCRYSPTCSHYAETAVREHGAIRGAGLAIWRVARCNPYGKGGIDPVPPPRSHGLRYDSIVRGPEEAQA